MKETITNTAGAVYVSETGDPTEYVYLGELATYDRDAGIREAAFKIAPEINRLADSLDRHVIGLEEAVKIGFEIVIPEISRVMVRAALRDVFGRVMIPAMREVCGAPLGLAGVAARRLEAMT